MGREIVYCFNCATRLTEAEFERGKAFRSGNKVVCIKCAKELGIKPPPGTGPVRRTTTTKIKAVPPREEEPEEAPEASGLSRRKLVLIAGAGGGGLVLVVLLLVLIFSGGESDEPAPTPPPEVAGTPDIPPPPAATAPSPGEMVARQALLKAQQFGKLNPNDLEGRIKALEQVAFKYDGSAAAREAMLELGGLRGKLRGQLRGALEEVEKEIEGIVADERYGRALEVLEEARGRRTETEWKLGVDRFIAETRRAYLRQFAELLDEAQEAALNGDMATAKKIRDRVATWGVEQKTKDFDEALADLSAVPAPKPKTAAAKPAAPKAAAPKKPAIPVDTPPTTAEGKSYRAAWEEALLRAAVRDHAGAAKLLEEAKDNLKDAALRKEAQADLKDLRSMEALWKKALDALAELRRGRTVALDVRDGAGNLSTIKGRTFEAGPERIELTVEKKKKTVFVEYSDLAGTCLSGIVKSAPRASALICLTEGELEAAKKVLGKKLEDAAGKYWAYAGTARERIPRPDPDARRRAQNALAIFYDAEREYRSMKTLGLAVEKYKRLVDDFAGVSEILRQINRIQRRSTEGREYVFVARELRGEGTFKLQDHEGEGKVWISTQDSDETMALYNLVDIQFYALPDVKYRLWVRVGGCCKDNFFFYHQATDLQVPDDEDRKKTITVSPGSDYALPVKHRIYNLKRNHGTHSKGPKTAARWEWVEVSLGKDPPPGFKHLRLITDQQGFGVAGVIVSSTLTRAPEKKEVRTLLDEREKEVPEEKFDPDLLGYWKLEEGTGDRVAEATGSGFDGELVKGAVWSEGRVGSALTFDGKNGAVKVPDDEALRITGDITIAFWMKKDKEATAWSRLVGKGAGGKRNYGVWEEAGGGKKILFQQYDKDGKSILELRSKSNVGTGKWTHVAAVVSGKKAMLYINGKLDGTLDREGTPGTSNDPVTFGQFPTYTAFPGSLDEIRIYRRALSADEILALVEKD